MEFELVSVQDTWSAMEGLVEKGMSGISFPFHCSSIKTYFIRNIGISNFNSQGLRDLMSFAKIKPSVLQVKIILRIAQ